MASEIESAALTFPDAYWPIKRARRESYVRSDDDLPLWTSSHLVRLRSRTTVRPIYTERPHVLRIAILYIHEETHTISRPQYDFHRQGFCEIQLMTTCLCGEARRRTRHKPDDLARSWIHFAFPKSFPGLNFGHQNRQFRMVTNRTVFYWFLTNHV